MKPVLVGPQAAIELSDTAVAYERTCPGAGIAFLSDIRETSRGLARVPQAAAHARGSISSSAAHRFPFRILHRERKGRIEVLAILPTRIPDSQPFQPRRFRGLE